MNSKTLPKQKNKQKWFASRLYASGDQPFWKSSKYRRPKVCYGPILDYYLLIRVLLPLIRDILKKFVLKEFCGHSEKPRWAKQCPRALVWAALLYANQLTTFLASLSFNNIYYLFKEIPVNASSLSQITAVSHIWYSCYLILFWVITLF